MATVCATLPAFAVAEPDPTSAAFAEFLARWDCLTEENKAAALPILRSVIEHDLADQGDSVAVAAREVRRKKRAEEWAEQSKEEDKERAKMAVKIAEVQCAKQHAYEQLLGAVEGTEAEAALRAESELSFYLDALRQPERYDISRIWGARSSLKRLTKLWCAKAEAAKAAKKAAGQ